MPSSTRSALKERVVPRRVEATPVDRMAYDAATAVLDGRTVTADAATLTGGVATDGTAALVRDMLDRIDPDRRTIITFEIRSATLDDVFLALTGRGAHRDADDREAARI